MPCPYCLSTDYSDSSFPTTIFNQKKFYYLQCTNCQIIYLNPFPSGSDYLKMYPPTYQDGVNKTVIKNISKKLPGLRFSYKKHFDLIKKYSVNGRVLDYGCGNGNFLANANAFNIKCDGAEFNQKQVEILKTNFPEVKIYEINHFLYNLNIKYDVIRLSNVLEHLDAPIEIISQLLSKLNNGGILLIEGPLEINFSLATISRLLYFKIRKRFQKDWTVNHTPTHITFTNYKSQIDFFKHFSMQNIHFEISESPWPYPDSVVNAVGIANKIKAVIALMSIFISKFNKNWGNTFIFIGKKI